MTIEIMNLRNIKPSQPYDVKVDRSSILGNPFPMYNESQRDTVCDQYAEYAKEQIKKGAYLKEMSRLYYLYKQHGRLRLFCWCAPKRCHAETIKTYIESIKEPVRETPQKYFTGVGSRKTPDNILDLMRIMAHIFEKKDFILRSGGANGADSAFEAGISNPVNKQIYYAKHATPAAMEIAGRFHPVWNKTRIDGSPVVSDYAKKLHGRNSFQVLGFNLNEPSKLLICWTPDGCTQHIGRSIQTGGTGTTISIAEAYGVKIINLQRPDHYQQAIDWVKRNYYR